MKWHIVRDVLRGAVVQAVLRIVVGLLAVLGGAEAVREQVDAAVVDPKQ